MVTLYYRDSVSDKVYQVSVDPVPGGYNVNFAYGRRGSTMTAGTKNSTPLTEAAANKMADKLVRDKMAKGYTEGETGAVYAGTNREERFTGVLPMLLNPIDESEMERYINDPYWALQPKYDGKRMLIRKHGNRIEAINRKGLEIGAPQNILDEVKQIPGNFTLDGECIGDFYWAFDVLSPEPFWKRVAALKDLLQSCGQYWVHLAPTYFDRADKAICAQTLKREQREGVVFKHRDMSYAPGRPNSGGPALKCKFTATANVRVVGLNDKRSVAIAMEDGTACGNVSVPANKAMPQIGQLIEVRYLYAMPSNALFQPVYTQRRDDMDVADTVNTLKYKRGEEEV